jgi:hypothetical protein
MATKGNCPCLDKASDEEPIFVLRAQDVSAPATILAWLKLNPQLPKAKREEAEDVIVKMRAWPTRKAAD